MPEHLPVAPFKKLLKETGLRVSNEAAEALAEIIEELGYIITEEAIEIAREKGRKTVTVDDIVEARRRLW